MHADKSTKLCPYFRLQKFPIPLFLTQVVYRRKDEQVPAAASRGPGTPAAALRLVDNQSVEHNGTKAVDYTFLVHKVVKLHL